MGIDITRSNGRHQIIYFVKVKFLGNLIVGRFVQAQSFEFSLQHLTAMDDILLPVLTLKPLADFAACARGLDIAQMRIQPIPAGTTPFGGEDLHLVTVA